MTVTVECQQTMYSNMLIGYLLTCYFLFLQYHYISVIVIHYKCFSTVLITCSITKVFFCFIIIINYTLLSLKVCNWPIVLSSSWFCSVSIEFTLKITNSKQTLAHSVDPTGGFDDNILLQVLMHPLRVSLGYCADILLSFVLLLGLFFSAHSVSFHFTHCT